MRRADRLFQIVQHLRARLTTAAQLARLLAVSERTVYRDIRDLSLSGIPVQGKAGVGYCLDRPLSSPHSCSHPMKSKPWSLACA
jgi:predicted DNA-binding transcriptional regulator YafY